ncbi:uncharacterized protein METZ01_LOCUS187008, partial [marine metagenome]
VVLVTLSLLSLYSILSVFDNICYTFQLDIGR